MSGSLSIPAGASSARRAVLDGVECRLLAVTTATGAIYGFAVGVGPNEFRITGLGGSPASATLSAEQVADRGLVPVTVILGDDRTASGSVTTRDIIQAEVFVVALLPSPAYWNGLRIEDVADAIDMAIQGALQTDGDVQNAGVWRSLVHVEGGSLMQDPETGVNMLARTFLAQYTNEVGRPWLGQSGVPTLANRRTIASIHANTGPEGNVLSASVQITRTHIVLDAPFDPLSQNPPDSDPATLELKAHTCGTLLDSIASVSWAVLNRDATLDATPAQDLFGKQDAANALGAGNAVALEVP